MKKTLITTVATGSLLVLGISIFSLGNAQVTQSGLTVEKFIAKAAAAEQKKASQGNYFHQKIKLVWPGSGKSYIGEEWIDKKNEDSISIINFFDKNNKPLSNRVTMFKNGRYYASSYLDNFGCLDPTVTSHIRSLDMSIVSEKLNEFLQTKGASLDTLKTLFVSDDPDAHNPQVDISLRFEGKNHFNGIEVETLILQKVIKNSSAVVQYKMYFDAQTFEFVGGQDFIIPHEHAPVLLNTQEVIESEYSNEIPTVKAGSLTLSLEPGFAPAQTDFCSSPSDMGKSGVQINKDDGAKK